MTSDSVGAIWKRTGKSSGKEYLSIVFTMPDGRKSEFIAFENDKGGNDKRPDFKIFKSTPRYGNGSAPNSVPRPNAPSPRPVATSASPAQPDFVDDPPF
jgi:uncharacterized protein (DUF736 family)